MKLHPLNILLLTNHQISNHVISLSQRVGEIAKTHFLLDPIKYIPHISIYHANYDNNSINQLIKTVASIANKTKPFEIDIAGYSYYADYLFLKVELTSAIKHLHMSVLDACSKLRVKQIPESIQELMLTNQLDKKQIELVEKFGHPLTQEFFAPHFTLARVKDIPEMSEIIQQLPETKLTMQVSSLAISNIGLHGTCNQVLKEFPCSQIK